MLYQLQIRPLEYQIWALDGAKQTRVTQQTLLENFEKFELIVDLENLTENNLKQILFAALAEGNFSIKKDILINPDLESTSLSITVADSKQYTSIDNHGFPITPPNLKDCDFFAIIWALIDGNQYFNAIIIKNVAEYQTILTPVQPEKLLTHEISLIREYAKENLAKDTNNE